MPVTDAANWAAGVFNSAPVVMAMAVAAETAIAMTTGALFKTPAARLAASVTGIAGPGGGSEDKPVGLVHFSCQWRGKPAVHDHQTFTGDRDTVRKKSLHKSLTMIYSELK